MARIRTIKPEFPQSETVGRLSRDARLLFVQLWTIADDAGRLRGASRMLASLLYPYDDDAPKLMPKWLEELEAKDCIRCYEVDGSQYIEIINWLKHQKIDRPSESRIPPYREGSTKPREESRASDADLGPRTSTKDQEDIRAVAKATRPSDSSFDEFWKVYPKREGANPKSPARKLFETAVKSRHEIQAIIGGAKRYAAECDRTKIAGTPHVAQAVTWLRQARWEDYPEAGNLTTESETDWDAAFARHKKYGTWPVKYLGPEPGSAGCRAPPEMLEKYGVNLTKQGGHDGESASHFERISGVPTSDQGARILGDVLLARVSGEKH
jgi:hypothetical protein